MADAVNGTREAGWVRSWRVWAGVAVLVLFTTVAIILLSGHHKGEALDPQVVGWAMDASYSPDAPVRTNAALKLRDMGTNAVPELLRLVRAKDGIVQEQLWDAAIKLPRGPRRFVAGRMTPPVLASVRAAGVRALGLFPEQSTDTIAAIAKALGDRSPEVRFAAANTLVSFGSNAAPALTLALGSADPNAREAAQHALGNMGPAAAPAVPALIQLLSDPQPKTREFAGNTLGRIGVPAVPALVDTLQTTNTAVRVAAARALSGLPARKLATGPLLNMASGADPSERAQAFSTLASIRATDEAVIQTMIAALVKDPDEYVRTAAASGLRDLSWKAQAAIPAVKQAQKDTSPLVREAASNALERINAAAINPP